MERVSTGLRVRVIAGLRERVSMGLRVSTGLLSSVPYN